MVDLKKLSNYIMKLILSVFLSYSFTLALCSSFFYEFKLSGNLVIYIILTLIILSLAFSNKLSMIISGISLLVLSISFTVYSQANGLLPEIFKDVLNFSDWIYDVANGADNINKHFDLYVTLLVSILISLIVYFLIIKKFNFYIVLIFGLTIFTLQWIFDFFVSYSAFYIFIIFILLSYFLHIYNAKSIKEKNDFASPAIFAVFVLPVCLLIFLLSLMMPVHDKPWDWPWLNDRAYSIIDFFDRPGLPSSSFEFFSVASTGFGDSGDTLGGKVQLDKTQVLSVASSVNNAYLKGASREVYTGTTWVHNEPESLLTPFSLVSGNNLPNDEIRQDLGEFNKGINLLADDLSTKDIFSRTMNLDITFLNLKTKSLFIPIKTENLQIKSKSIKAYINSEDTVLSKKYLSKNFNYTIDGYSFDYKNSDLINILQKSKRGLYNEFISLVNETNQNQLKDTPKEDFVLIPLPESEKKLASSEKNNYKIINNISLDNLYTFANHSQDIYNKYLKLPSTLPIRVSKLATEITKSYLNNYDKAKAIEQYLSKNYPYTLSPNTTPAGRDFVDYFLFDEKKGYCTYFASAMVVMARSIGLPARYVEGYILPAQISEDSKYIVTNQQAHAWVELYFEGFGWVPFEPTSPFAINFYRDQISSANLSTDFTNDPEYQAYLDELEKYGSQDDINIEIDTSLSDTEQRVIWPYFLIGFIILMILTFIIMLITNYIRYKLSHLKALRLEPRDSVLKLYKYYLKLLALQGIPLLISETPLQYSDRVIGNITYRYDSSKKTSFAVVTNIFIIARFSLNEVSEADKSIVLDFNDIILEKTKMRIGKLKFFIYRFILGSI